MSGNDYIYWSADYQTSSESMQLNTKEKNKLESESEHVVSRCTVETLYETEERMNESIKNKKKLRWEIRHHKLKLSVKRWNRTVESLSTFKEKKNL